MSCGDWISTLLLKGDPAKSNRTWRGPSSLDFGSVLCCNESDDVSWAGLNDARQASRGKRKLKRDGPAKVEDSQPIDGYPPSRYAS